MITTGANLPDSAHDPNAITQIMRRNAAKGGRPADYTPELAANILDLIIDGKSLRAIAATPGMPALSTIMDWRGVIPAFAEQYARARTLKGEIYAEDGVAILDDCEAGSMAEVRKAEARAKHRLELAKCYDRPLYGDKLGVSHDVVVESMADRLTRLTGSVVTIPAEFSHIIEE